MRHCILLLTIIISISFLTACTAKQASSTSGSEEILRYSDSQSILIESSLDTLKNGPFNKQVSIFVNDDNGGYEEYRLTMNLYKKDIPDGKDSECHGTLVLYVKTPDNTEGIEVSRRLINQVDQIEENIAELHMSSSEERPQTFKATLTYNPEDYTYSLKMSVPASLEDLMANQLTLQ